MDYELFELIPHRPPILAIDRLVKCDENSAVATVSFSGGRYGTSGEFVDEPLLIECVAQTAAAANGLRERKSGKTPKIGMLVGINDFKIYSEAKCGLEIEAVTVVEKMLGSFSIVRGKVKQEGNLLAEGTLKFYVDVESDG
jgi:predicted hotdog family 3-hydroxylacyl-ACP dehydratase